MSWDHEMKSGYRVIRSMYEYGGESFPRYDVMWVYVDDDTGPYAMSINGALSHALGVEDLESVIYDIGKAFELPVLNLTYDEEYRQILTEVSNDMES